MKAFIRIVSIYMLLSMITNGSILAEQSEQAEMFTISGSVGIPGVEIQGLPEAVFSDSGGGYRVEVPSGFSGTVIPEKDGYSFQPSRIVYTEVTQDYINQNYLATEQNITGLNTTLFLRQPSVWSLSTSTRSTRSVISQDEDRRVLIVPADDMDSSESAQTSEDLLVMSEILDERFEEPRLIEGVFRDFGDFFGRDNRQTEAVYMQDYGVVFMMEVNYAFNTSSVEQEQTDEQDSNDADSTWQRVRERVLNPQASSQAGRAERETEEMMVEQLKAELIKTLKYAANIRIIQPEEWVILSVRGTVSSSSTREIRIGTTTGYGSTGGYGTTESYSGGGGGGMSGYGGGGGYGTGYGTTGGYSVSSRNPAGMGVSAPATVMTIRVKKSDIDLYAQEELDYEQFRQKVQILVY